MTDRQINDRKIEKERELFTTDEAAIFLRTSPVTLWRERKAGRISFHRIASKIVYTRQDLENYLKRNKREAFSVKNMEVTNG